MLKVRALPLEPIFTVNDERQNLPLGAFQQLEAATLQLLAALRQAGNFVPSTQLPPALQNHTLTICDLCNEFLLAKARAGRSDNYLRLMLKELKAFSKGRESRAALSVSSAEIETWLYAQPWKARTRKGALMTLRNIFQWSISRGMMAANPANGVDMPAQESLPPGIHTPEQAKIVLEAARRIDLNVMRCLAVRYFAGLRTSEAVALEETEIKEQFIEVTAAKAKTRRRRLVTIQPNLRAWLDLGGTLPLRQVNNRLRAVTLSIPGVPWPHNATRHSFASYHLAKFGNAGKTALEAGHTEQMLFNHYREIVLPEDAEKFFNIRPD